jgi:hypothetical protein
VALTDEEVRVQLVKALEGVPAMLNVALLGVNPSQAEALNVARMVRELYDEAEKSLGKDAADHLVLPTLEGAKARILEVFGTSGWDEPEDVATAAAKMGSLDRARRDDAARAVFQLADEARFVTDEDLEDLEGRGLADVAAEIRRLREMVHDRDLLLLRAVAALKVINEQMRRRGLDGQAVQLTEVVIRAIEAQVGDKQIP